MTSKSQKASFKRILQQSNDLVNLKICACKIFMVRKTMVCFNFRNVDFTRVLWHHGLGNGVKIIPTVKTI